MTETIRTAMDRMPVQTGSQGKAAGRRAGKAASRERATVEATEREQSQKS